MVPFALGWRRLLQMLVLRLELSHALLQLRAFELGCLDTLTQSFGRGGLLFALARAARGQGVQRGDQAFVADELRGGWQMKEPRVSARQRQAEAAAGGKSAAGPRRRRQRRRPAAAAAP